MSGWDQNDKQISAAQGSFLDFRPEKVENEEKPPSDDGEGQVNESFGKLIIFVSSFLWQKTMQLNDWMKVEYSTFEMSTTFVSAIVFSKLA